MKNIIITKGLQKDGAYIREEVFMKEQGFENEFDDIDERAYHTVLYVDGAPAANGRLFTDDPERKIWTVGRIAVLKEMRKLHLGSDIMQILEEQCKAVGGERIQLSAQCQAQPFYEKCGYCASGEVYMDEHCPHIHMEKVL